MTGGPLIFLGATAVPELIDVLVDINQAGGSWAPRGILDDNPDLAGTTIAGLPVLGPLERVAEHPDARFVFAIGSHSTRLARHSILCRLDLPDDRYATLIHPGAKVYASASIGAGSIIHFGAVIANGVRLGRWVIVLWNSVIGADSRVGDGALITSQVTTNSGVRIGSYSFIGSASAIAEAVTIGPGAMVGMRSLVLRNVASGTFQFGDPPRILSRQEVPDGIIANWEEFTR
ncbi:acetyltransferase [Magnetospirillum moscoviense]|uniref:acetyltransferase n=1 Tax=Magnetospirillum moscoviense TaxID=1437059 RepID=UPI000B1575DC|nr:acetyltransferase [Magnetospirillum moscoviense]